MSECTRLGAEPNKSESPQQCIQHVAVTIDCVPCFLRRLLILVKNTLRTATMFSTTG